MPTSITGGAGNSWVGVPTSATAAPLGEMVVFVVIGLILGFVNRWPLSRSSLLLVQATNNSARR